MCITYPCFCSNQQFAHRPSQALIHISETGLVIQYLLRWITSKFICFWWSVCSNYSVWINNSFLGCLLLMRFTHSARGHIFVFVFVFVTCAFYSLRSRSLSSRNLPWTSGIDIMLHCYTFQFDQFALLHKEHFWRMKIWNAIELNINRSSLTSNNVYL